MITDPYRIVSEEAQLRRVVVDLTKTTEAFQTGGKGSCSTLSKTKKTKKVCLNTHAMKYVCKGQVSCLFLLAKWIFTICVTDCLYPAIRRPLNEGSNTYLLNRQPELLLFTHSSSEGSLSKIYHMEQAVPKVVVLLNRVR